MRQRFCFGFMVADVGIREVGEYRELTSRRERLDHAFLAKTLKNEKSSDRIASDFRNSIFDLLGQEIASIRKVRIVCNSDLDAADGIVSEPVGPVLILCPSTLTLRISISPWPERDQSEPVAGD